MMTILEAPNDEKNPFKRYSLLTITILLICSGGFFALYWIWVQSKFINNSQGKKIKRLINLELKVLSIHIVLTLAVIVFWSMDIRFGVFLGFTTLIITAFMLLFILSNIFVLLLYEIELHLEKELKLEIGLYIGMFFFFSSIVILQREINRIT